MTDSEAIIYNGSSEKVKTMIDLLFDNGKIDHNSDIDRSILINNLLLNITEYFQDPKKFEGNSFLLDGG